MMAYLITLSKVVLDPRSSLKEWPSILKVESVA